MTQYPLIQVVNEDDEPIAAAPLGEVYAQGLIHRVVFTFVEDPSGNILLQKRSPNVMTYPGSWDISSAGHVDEGEDYLEAAERELQEELGVIGFPLRQIDSFRDDETYEGHLLKRFKRVYKTVIPADTPLKLNPEEVTATKWFHPKEIRRLLDEQPEEFASGIEICFKREHWS